MDTLRARVIRLAHAQPSLRPHLLPLLAKTAADPNRESNAKAIARAIDSVTGRMSYSGTDEAEISPDFRTIEGAYRSDLPKEGAYFVGEYEYERMVSEETARAREALTPALAPYKDMIARVSIYAEEKSWVYISVTLK